jgi:hypothetical protein
VLFLTEHYAINAYWGSRCIAPRILWPRHYMEMSGQFHAPAALPPGKEPRIHVGYEAGWVPEPFWTRWWREKFPAPAGNRTLESRSSSCCYFKENCIFFEDLLPQTPTYSGNNIVFTSEVCTSSMSVLFTTANETL